MSMKKQEFCSFYISDAKDELESKLAKTYTNRFCIDENDQFELSGFHQITKKFYTRKFYSIAAFMKYVKILLLNKIELHREVISTTEEPKGDKQRSADTDLSSDMSSDMNFGDEYSKHLIFVLPFQSEKETDHKIQPDFTCFVSTGAARHWYKILEYTSKINFTILNGQNAKADQTYDGQNPNGFTIGDDIELMYNQLQCENFTTFRNKGSSLFLNDDESFMEIKCKRKSAIAITKKRNCDH